ncbi:hypothetical protein J4216_05110 [Candidatus Woesearchaeota archaeon]|nr:hypothetical protein [Candidatus Woesearchaeota archaeon]
MQNQNIKQMESNVIGSFNLVKNDFYKLINLINTLQKEIEILKISNSGLRRDFSNLKQKIDEKSVKPLVKPSSKGFLASKSGEKYHNDNCFLGKKIKSINRVWFNDKINAVSEGYSACVCSI